MINHHSQAETISKLARLDINFKDVAELTRLIDYVACAINFLIKQDKIRIMGYI